MRASIAHSPAGRPAWLALLACLLAAGALASLPAPALAAPPALLWQVPEDGASGTGAGRFGPEPRGVAAAAETEGMPAAENGHVFVVDRASFRIDEFTAWGEFRRAWGWGVRDGSAELQTCGPAASPPSETCLKGLRSVKPGALPDPTGIAVDGNGDVYVQEDEECTEGLECVFQNFRVQKFDPTAGLSGEEVQFVLMFGGEVNKTKTAEAGSTEAERNLCTAASGDECGIGTLGGGQGQFADRTDLGAIAAGPGDTIYVGDVGRIQRFGAGGVFEGETTGDLAGETIRSLAVDSAGSSYVSYSEGFRRSKDDIRKISPTGAEGLKFDSRNPGAFAVDEAGNVYAVDVPGFVAGKLMHVVIFSANGTKLVPSPAEEAEFKKLNEEKKPAALFGEVHNQGGSLTGLAVGGGCEIPGADLYVVSSYVGEAYVTSYGPPPDPTRCPPPPRPPTIIEQFAKQVNPEGATLRARINPHFWPDVTFFVEYGEGLCSAGGCESKQPLGGEAAFGTRVVNAGILSPDVHLSGLTPATTYHFRFVAKSSGGGPVVGVGGSGEEGTFMTPAARVPLPDFCANAAFRTGPAAFLPDCRAYELVSPIDKNGGDIFNLLNLRNRPAEVDQSALSGDKLTYSSYRAFGDAASAPYTSQYIATRDPVTGWSSEGISPPRGQGLLSVVGLNAEYQGFSADLCKGWLLHDSEPPLTSGAAEGFANLYRRNECGEAPAYETVTTGVPQCQTARSYLPELQGTASDSQHVVFAVADRLVESAAQCKSAAEPVQCYDSFHGKLRMLSVLPNGTVSTNNCSLGFSASLGSGNYYSNVAHAFSEDGSRAFWTASGASGHPGALYLRRNPSKPQSNLSEQICTESLKGCTIDVSGTVGPAPATYWGASSDGSRVIFSMGSENSPFGPLYEARVVEQGTTLAIEPSLIANECRGVLGMSADAKTVYLASEEALTAGASTGKPNLYIYRVGEAEPFRFIGTLSALDVADSQLRFPSPISPVPTVHTARVSEDGETATFMSSASLTGFDNRDAETGEADAEVYHYDARGSGSLDCVSCGATNARPAGRELLVENTATGVRAAAQIPGWSTSLYGSRALSEDGSRLFFESFAPLVPGDTNERQDVYEWEAVESGTCSTASPSYSPANGGCISLISSGESSQDSRFVDASGDGRDVFFATGQSLLSRDPGLIDIYDARAGGGFPEPATAASPCQGESCQGPAGNPEDPTPASSTYSGPGNLKPEKSRHRKKHKKHHHSKRHGRGHAGAAHHSRGTVR